MNTRNACNKNSFPNGMHHKLLPERSRASHLCPAELLPELLLGVLPNATITPLQAGSVCFEHFSGPCVHESKILNKSQIC